MKKLKMLGATAQGDANLCVTCRHSQRTRFAHSNEEFTLCKANYENVVTLRGRVAECTNYDDSRLPTLHSMSQIAWLVSADKKGGPAGFLTPAQVEKAKDDGKLSRHEPVVLPDGGVWHL